MATSHEPERTDAERPADHMGRPAVDGIGGGCLVIDFGARRRRIRAFAWKMRRRQVRRPAPTWRRRLRHRRQNAAGSSVGTQ
jgi:hypothetical protein